MHICLANKNEHSSDLWNQRIDVIIKAEDMIPCLLAISCACVVCIVWKDIAGISGLPSV